MSWIVEHLIRNSETIKSKMVSESPEDDRIEYDLDSDEYNNLLIVEKKISDLYRIGLLSDSDISIIKMFISDVILNDTQRSAQQKKTLLKHFRNICSKIGYMLGGYFTDDGFIISIKNNYRLSDSDFITLNEYMAKRRSKIK